MKVLAVRLSAIGDIVHTMPTIVAIKRAHPDWEVHWAVSNLFRGVLEDHRAVDRLVEIPRRPYLGQLWELRKELTKERYDIALDMQGLLKSAMVVGLSGAKRKLGYHLQREGARLFSQPIKPPREGLHVIEQYLPVAQALGCEPFPVEFWLAPTPISLESMVSKLDSLRLPGRPLALNLGAGRDWKQWPRERFAELIPIARGMGWAPFLIGGPADVPLEVELQSMLAIPVPSLIGKTSLPELTAVLSLSAAHVGGDTGSTHIAVALGKPLVCIMPMSLNKATLERTGPYKREAFTLANNDLSAISANDVAALLEKF